jgi:hypothetical protein
MTDRANARDSSCEGLLWVDLDRRAEVRPGVSPELHT